MWINLHKKRFSSLNVFWGWVKYCTRWSAAGCVNALEPLQKDGQFEMKVWDLITKLE